MVKENDSVLNKQSLLTARVYFYAFQKRFIFHTKRSKQAKLFGKFLEYCFSNLLIIHEENTTEINV